VPATERAGAEPISVILIEDHVMIAESMRMAIERHSDMRVVGVGRSIADGEKLLRAERPDVVMLDFRLPDGEAPLAIATYLAIHPSLRIVVVSGTADTRTVVGALEAGACGYLLKEQPLEELIEGIRVVAGGGQAVAQALVPLLGAQIGRPAPASQRLRPGEVEVLRLLSLGMSTTDLASTLSISVNTVRNHFQSAITRLGAHSKLEAVSIALSEGLIPPPDR
jgi:two-component system nitrate/nitrite response regulator NarL